MANSLHCGDNLTVLRDAIGTGTIRAVYLDPPFNSGQDWHLTLDGRTEVAFTDKWTWTEDAAQQYKECCAASPVTAAHLDWFRGILGESGALAYLAHMALRFPELHRVLTGDGALFLHCDPTMSHYLKILLDCAFGEANFAGEITWKRTSAHKTTRGLGRIHDQILVYRRSPAAAWCGPDGADLSGGSDQGSVWLDIPPLNAKARERTGYPTQKPGRLLDRIIAVSAAGPGDMLLDPNAGCGTSLEAAHRAGLAWAGIDLNPAAVALAQERLRRHGAEFTVHGADRLPADGDTLF